MCSFMRSATHTLHPQASTGTHALIVVSTAAKLLVDQRMAKHSLVSVALIQLVPGDVAIHGKIRLRGCTAVPCFRAGK